MSILQRKFLLHKEPTVVPSSIDIALQASHKGNFPLARQMMLRAMRELDGQVDKPARLIELITKIADTYVTEGKYDSARAWYTKALHRLEVWQGSNSLAVACVMVRLAQVCVWQFNMTEFQEYFDQVERAYLLSQDMDVSVFLDALIELSWALCIHECVNEVQLVNNLIAEIKQLEAESKPAAED